MQIKRLPTAGEIRDLLRLDPDADIARPWDELGTDSWDLVELRAVLEATFGLAFPDEQWVEMSCPNDLLKVQPA